MASASEVIAKQLGDGSARGARVSVVENGRTQLDLTMGESQAGVAMPDDAVFLWLSSGKPLTAIAIAALLEDELLRLDDPVARYIPAFAAGAKASLTIRHLLTHTAGLHKASAALWDRSDWASVLARICHAAIPADFELGRDAAYDPAASWFLLGEIIQCVADQPFETFMQQRIFRPAGMTDTGYILTSADAARLGDRLAHYESTANGQNRLLNYHHPELAGLPRPGASLRATIGDIVSFYEALSAGQIVRPDILDAFTSPQRGRLFDRTFGVPLDWGLGIMVNNGPEVPYAFGAKASPAAFGHGGQQSSLVFRDPVRRITFAVNYNGLPGERAHNQRLRQLLDACGL